MYAFACVCVCFVCVEMDPHIKGLKDPDEKIDLLGGLEPTASVIVYVHASMCALVYVLTYQNTTCDTISCYFTC